VYITNTKIEKVFQVHLHRVYQPARTFGNTTGHMDRLTLSKQAGEIQSIKQFVAGLPGVRESKVSHLKSTIQSGEYEIAGPKLAETIFETVRRERLGL